MLDPNFASRVNELIQARGAEYVRLVADRREGQRQRKRDARKRQMPEQREHDRVRKWEARKRQTPEQRDRETQRGRDRSRTKIRPFMAIDGEGGGTDALGRQNYLSMVAAGTEVGEERILQREGRHLLTHECLEFILSLPADPHLVGYGFGYDSTQILRGIKQSTLRRILNPPPRKNASSYTYWGEYAIDYQQGQYFRVARVDRSGPKPSVIEGSSRTVYETLRLFQCAFVKAIDNWTIGSDWERAIIAENKARRDEFSTLTKGMIEYCKLECRHLVLLMTAFRDVCAAVGIFPERWSGAGWLAAALLKKYGVPKRPLTTREIADRAERKPSRNSKPEKPRRPERDRAFEVAANHAYYGGRSEVSRIGSIRGPVFEYDLRSAYPAAMLDLPCPLHTRWQHRPRAKSLPQDGLYLAKISFAHPDGPWCGFPFRHNRRLFCPFQGTGWYWSPEIQAAQRSLGADVVVVHNLWIARRNCDCRAFDWVSDLYEERRRIGSKTKGYPLKLGLNSLYGKAAQRSGRGPYHDPVSAGLITAITRARLTEAVGQNPGAVVMLATDAVFSTEPLSLDIGEGLGQWEENIWPDLFIAQPGVYWSPADLKNSVKSRGAPRSIIGPAAPRFYKAFNDWLDVMRGPGAMQLLLDERSIPSVPVTVRVFYAHRLALARGKPWLAGKWEDVSRHESFEWSTKRDAMRIALGDEFIITYPIALSSPLAESEGYKPADFDRMLEISTEAGAAEEIDENTLLEAMPDHVQFLPHA
jgi:hypothetical protein